MIDGTNQTHSITEIYYVHLYQNTNFLKLMCVCANVCLYKYVLCVHNFVYATYTLHATTLSTVESCISKFFTYPMSFADFRH